MDRQISVRADHNAKDIELWNEANRRLDELIAATPNFQDQLSSAVQCLALQQRVKHECRFDTSDFTGTTTAAAYSVWIALPSDP